MKTGKLKNSELESLILNNIKHKRKEVEAAPHIGVDCARVHIDGVCALSSDPITAAKNRIGYLTVHINCNDAAAAGAEPIGLVVTILAPPSVTEEELGNVANEIAAAAEAANVDIIGGHTEVTPSVNQIITSATVIGKPLPDYTGVIRDGDYIVMTKYAGLEGSAVLANDKPEDTGLTSDELETAKDMLSYLSVVPEGMYAASHGAHAMHDITEGGVLGAIWELAYSANKGCIIDTDAIPVHDVTRKLCKAFNIDPLKLISSGSLLIACADGESMVKGLAAIGITSSVIGKITGDRIMDSHGNIIPQPESDDLYKAL